MPDWPHAPIHKLSESGAYMVTGGTYQKRHHLSDADRLDFFRDTLFDLGKEFGWHFQAWAILANHYHFVAVLPDGADNLSTFLSKLHMVTAKELNRLDEARGRRVWYQFWDSHITYQRSYLARLNYVHNNPVHHGVVEVATQYPWCSAAWFEGCAPAAFRETVGSFKTDQLNVVDDF
jgi:REP-associated tyrosine transposase